MKKETKILPQLAGVEFEKFIKNKPYKYVDEGCFKKLYAGMTRKELIEQLLELNERFFEVTLEGKIFGVKV